MYFFSCGLLFSEIKSQSKKKKLINSKIKKRSKFLRKKGSIKLKRCSSKIAASLALEERDVLKSFPKVGGNGYSGIKWVFAYVNFKII